MQARVAVIIDDRFGRRAARQQGLEVFGSAGVLPLAKQQGIIVTVRPILDELRASGLYLGDATYQLVLSQAGE